MGYVRHHAIICSGPAPVDDLSRLEPFLHKYVTSLGCAHEQAIAIFGDLVSPIMTSPVNSVGSFFVATDGSQEGWEDSDEGDAKRDSFITYLRSQYYDDGSSAVKWAEVQYGDDELETVVTRSSDADQKQFISEHPEIYNS